MTSHQKDIVGIKFMTEYQDDYCAVVRGFLDETTVQTLSTYMQNKYHSKNWDVRPENFDTYVHNPSKYHHYADPLAEVVLASVTHQVEETIGLKLFPTYSFSRIYVSGDTLTPHVDRPSCEVSVTVNIEKQGSSWPIWMKAPNREPLEVLLNPGDAVIYKGCEVLHWRDPLQGEHPNVQFMLHYVDQNGPYADYKFDTRPALGFPSSARRS